MASNIFDIFFDSYGEAAFKLLEQRGFKPTWLAKKIKPENVKLSSVQSQITRWKKGAPVSDEYQDRINKALDITIKQDSKGKWFIVEGYSAQKAIDQSSASEKSINDLLKSDTSRDEILEFLLKRDKEASDFLRKLLNDPENNEG